MSTGANIGLLGVTIALGNCALIGMLGCIYVQLKRIATALEARK